jgi:uncharacterized membrane-anchored protein YhcB (DUF1043 family)
MTLEIFRAVTPFITLLLMVGVWVIGWLVKRLIAESSQHFTDLKKELKHKIDQLRYFPKADHDDGPDALEMVFTLITHHNSFGPRIRKLSV